MDAIGNHNRQTVPYAPWAQVKTFLDKIRVLSPKIIDHDFLKLNQMGGKQPGPLLGAIQFLALVDTSGSPSPNLEKLKVKGDDQYKAALAEIVRQSYSELIEALDISVADRNMIFNQIRSVYQCSPRVAESATPLFIALCQESGIETQAAIQQHSNSAERRTRKAKNEAGLGRSKLNADGIQQPPVVATNPSGNGVGGQGALIPQIALHINMDSATTSEQIDNIFASMAKHFYGGGSA